MDMNHVISRIWAVYKIDLVKFWLLEFSLLLTNNFLVRII